MTEQKNQTMVEWLDIKLNTLSSDERMRLVEEVFDTLTAQELMSMGRIAEEKRKGKLEEAKQLVIEKMRGEFEQLGLTIEEVFPSRRKSRASGSTLKAKYRSADGENSWSGRGFKPVWLRDLEAQGHDIEEFLVKDE
jgi:DNA-binding protein H-NS